MVRHEGGPLRPITQDAGWHGHRVEREPLLVEISDVSAEFAGRAALRAGGHFANLDGAGRKRRAIGIQEGKPAQKGVGTSPTCFIYCSGSRVATLLLNLSLVPNSGRADGAT